jgi:hypothetical protein
MAHQAQEVVLVAQAYSQQFLVLIQHMLEVVAVALALEYQMRLVV